MQMALTRHRRVADKALCGASKFCRIVMVTVHAELNVQCDVDLLEVCLRGHVLFPYHFE